MQIYTTKTIVLIQKRGAEKQCRYFELYEQTEKKTQNDTIK